jgi:hypothetical protein
VTPYVIATTLKWAHEREGLMKRLKVALLLLVVGWFGQSVWAADPVNLPFDTYSGYFVSNKFEPDAAESFLIITDQGQFDRVFGVAMVMGDKSHRLSKNAFKSNIVLAAIKRGKAFSDFKVEAVTEAAGVVELQYTTTEKKNDSATFACPLIVSIPRGRYVAVRFTENGKMMKKIGIGKEVPKKGTVEIRRIDKSRVDIKVTSDRPFPVNTTMVLSIGEQKTNISRYAKNKLNILVFTMPAEDFAKTQDGDAITVSCGPDSRWDFGKLDKSKVEE